jgi:hypothetical protein
MTTGKIRPAEFMRRAFSKRTHVTVQTSLLCPGSGERYAFHLSTDRSEPKSNLIAEDFANENYGAIPAVRIHERELDDILPWVNFASLD